MTAQIERYNVVEVMREAGYFSVLIVRWYAERVVSIGRAARFCVVRVHEVAVLVVAASIASPGFTGSTMRGNEAMKSGVFIL